MMDDASTEMQSEPANYNLDAFSLGEFPTTDGTMSVDKTDAEIVGRNMGRIEEALADAQAKLGSAPRSSPTPRSFGVGYSSTGTHASASELYNLTSQCLQRTTAEYGLGLELFDATINGYFESDADSQQAIKEILADEALSADMGN